MSAFGYDPICLGDDSGSIVLTASGGSGQGYSYDVCKKNFPEKNKTKKKNWNS